VTATRDRRSDLVDTPAEVPVAERSMLGRVRGIPVWAAVLLALLLTGIGVFVDPQPKMGKGLGLIGQACYFLGCLLAVCWVRRRGVFGPMVQPPLVMVVVIPTVVLLSAKTPPGQEATGGMTEKALTLAGPMINSFPAMAITTGVTVVLGILRMVWQRMSAPAPAEPDEEEGFLDDLRSDDPGERRRPRPAEERRERGPRRAPVDDGSAEEARESRRGGPRRPQPAGRAAEDRPVAPGRRSGGRGPAPEPPERHRERPDRRQPGNPVPPRGQGVPPTRATGAGGAPPAGGGRPPRPGRPATGGAGRAGGPEPRSGRGSGPRQVPPGRQVPPSRPRRRDDDF